VNLVGVEGLSWTMLRSREEDNENCDPLNVEVMAKHHNNLSIALTIMHECFVPIIESRTKKDLIIEVIFNRGLVKSTFMLKKHVVLLSCILF
jgi:hypothetical protein